MSSSADELRAEFEELVHALDSIPDDEDLEARKTNALSDQLRARVEEWDEQGVTREVLEPLMDSDDVGLRCSAAGYMLRRGTQERSLAILRAIADDRKAGNARQVADTALLGWEIEQAENNQQQL